MNEPPTTPLQTLLEDLQVAPADGNRYRGRIPRRNLPRMFGGQVLGQGLLAGGYSCPPDRPVNSLHCYFLRPGDPTRPVDYEVTGLRDGRAFSARRVDAFQGDRLLATLAISFHQPELFLEHDDVSDPQPPGDPDDAVPLAIRLQPDAAVLPAWWTDPSPFDLRFLDEPSALAGGPPRPARQGFWIRTDGAMPDDPLLHAAVLAYASDLNLLDVALLPHGASWYDRRKVFGASIDHTLWFHETLRVDSWIFCDQRNERLLGGRALCSARFLDTQGRLQVTAAQEGLLRPVPANRITH